MPVGVADRVTTMRLGVYRILEAVICAVAMASHVPTRRNKEWRVAPRDGDALIQKGNHLVRDQAAVLFVVFAVFLEASQFITVSAINE
jgi:hypothetical protein